MATIEELVGEGRQYKTPDDLARGKIAADEHIRRVESENAELRKERDELKMQGDIFERLKDELQPAREAEVPTPQETPAPVAKDPAPAQRSEPAGDEPFEDKVVKALETFQQKQRTEENIQRSLKLLKQEYGDKAADALKKRATESGLGEAFLNDVAARSPEAFADFMGIKTVDKQEIPQRTPATRSSAPLPEAQEDGMSASLARRKQIGDSNYYSPAEQRRIFEKAMADPNFLKR